MVNGLNRALEVPSLLGVFEGTDIPDEGHWEAVATRAGLIGLVKFVVEVEELLVQDVVDPALVGIASTNVRRARDDVGGVLLGDVVDSESILVLKISVVSTSSCSF